MNNGRFASYTPLVINKISAATILAVSIGIHSQQLQSLWWYQIFYYYYRTLEAKDVNLRCTATAAFLMRLKPFCPRFPDGRDGTMIPGEKQPRVKSRVVSSTTPTARNLYNIMFEPSLPWLVIVQHVETGVRPLLLCTKRCHLGWPGIPWVGHEPTV